MEGVRKESVAPQRKHTPAYHPDLAYALPAEHGRPRISTNSTAELSGNSQKSRQVKDIVRSVSTLTG